VERLKRGAALEPGLPR